MSTKEFIKQHPIFAYFTMVFTISWGGIFLAVGPKGFQSSGTQSWGQFLLVFLAMGAGPSLTSILLTGIVGGREGLRDLFSRLGRWRVNLSWYGAALLLNPLLLIAIFSFLTLLSPSFIPGIIKSSDKISMLGIGITGGLAAGFLEELGWMGFALPKMQLKYGALKAALLLGVIHGIWHFLSDYWGNAGFAGFYGSLYLLRFFLWVVVLTAQRVLITWVYNNTGSLLLAQLMHAGSTGGQFILDPLRSTAVNEILWYGTFAVALWVIVAIVVVTTGKHLMREPLDRIKTVY